MIRQLELTFQKMALIFLILACVIQRSLSGCTPAPAFDTTYLRLVFDDMTGNDEVVWDHDNKRGFVSHTNNGALDPNWVERH